MVRAGFSFICVREAEPNSVCSRSVFECRFLSLEAVLAPHLILKKVEYWRPCFPRGVESHRYDRDYGRRMVGWY